MSQQFTDDELAEMLEACADMVRAWCRRAVSDPEAADDLWQDAMTTAWEKRHSFEGRSRLSTWAIGFAKYKLLNIRRKRGEVLTEDGILDQDEPGVQVLRDLRRAERENFVIECVSTLDPLEADVVYQRYAENMALSEIDQELSAQGHTVGSRAILQRLKRKLRKTMRARLAEMGHGTSFVRTSW